MSNKQFQNTINWYDSNAEQYAKTVSSKPISKNLNFFLNYLPPKAKILDAGCAGGRDTSEMYNKGFEVTGIDLSIGLINIAKKNYPEIPFLQGDFRNMPFTNKSFDGIWSNASLVHLPTTKDTQLAISEFSRILKNNGILYLYVKGQKDSEKIALKTDDQSDLPRLFQYYTQDELTEYLTKAGFSVLINERHASKTRKNVEWILVIGKKQ